MKDKFDFNGLMGLSEDEAREILEKILWADGQFCPKCGSVSYYKLTPKPDSKRPVRKGVYKCKDCRSQYSVTVGTIFEGSKIPLRKWLAVISLACSSKKGISAHQVHRMFNLSYKTAWFMMHRIRYIMDQSKPDSIFSGIIEIDECYIGGANKGKRGRPKASEKAPVISLIERNGRVRSQKVDAVSAQNIKQIVSENVDKNAQIMTDEFISYKSLDNDYKNRQFVKHGRREYVRGNVHTNTIEGFFSLLKRGILGSYHHISKQHLPLYLHEFDFRYNWRFVGDLQRSVEAIKLATGKRMYYRKPLGA